MLRLASVNSEVSVVADQYGSPTYAPDIAQAIIEVASHLLAEPRMTNCVASFMFAGAGRLVGPALRRRYSVNRQPVVARRHR